ncbi:MULTISPECIES: MBL fold metallo-hydrolase [Sphingobacterium]|uniref:MBL fold metallo-hydrolase n=1 Tax=Sphingobacterium kitahiroshimense TaxID=470446 RepID=A0ABV0BS01_9SPHI|nr:MULTISPECIES: MBL fold metallo-hydrolase [Sphingobacterium]MCW2263651.1 glyoxylase-like metal-dependent hydrolase (beta-lactamase superfamily II) [Sphingobacterium kitahiroshimense]QQD13290.1 MBL fold metallo-hydrolase [Sphingobacterium sp. UDSM-2020]TCR03871.1 glyoxylase-like metal-dependent hydrolase (beta-lactamase superfamily II) [Sphingobacterium sp. JUb78]
MQLYTIETQNFKLDGGAMFGVVPKSIWHKTNPADANNMCTWTNRLLLIEDGAKLILIDTGLGDKQSEKFFGHYYIHGDNSIDKSLAKYGFNREDITDVILTHLHFDHCGGAIVREGEKLRPSFTKANYWSNAEHWNWATNPNPREKASFLEENIKPIQESGQLKFVEKEKNPFGPDIQIRYAHGHTESMMLPQIKYKDKTILYMADLLPSVGHIPLPYVMGYDVRPLTTMEERKNYWEEIVDQEYILFLEHDAVNACCTLQHTEKGIRLKDSFQLSDI